VRGLAGPERNRAAASEMYAEDRASQSLGISIVEVDDGRAVAEMTVRDDMVNGLDVCHGGLIFTLADTAMAFATNGPGTQAFATHAEIDFVSAARAGTRLRAEAATVVQRGRATIVDAIVRDDSGQIVGAFRGRTLAVG